MNLVKLIRKKSFIAGLPKTAGSANVMIENQEGQLLVVKSGYKSYWSLPGGWIDKGETPRQAAIREVQEEINYSISESDIDLSRVIHRRSSAVTTYQFVFSLNQSIAAGTSFDLQVAEIDEYAWVSRDDVLQPSDGRSYNQSVKSWAEGGSAYVEVDF